MTQKLDDALSLLQCTLVAERAYHVPEKVTWAQYDVLEMLRLSGSLMPATLSTQLGISRPNLSKSIRHLKSLGFIEQMPSKDDGRSLITDLTPAGNDFLKRAANGRQVIIDVVQKNLSEGEQAIFIELANKISTQLLKTREK